MSVMIMPFCIIVITFSYWRYHENHPIWLPMEIILVLFPLMIEAVLLFIRLPNEKTIDFILELVGIGILLFTISINIIRIIYWFQLQKDGIEVPITNLKTKYLGKPIIEYEYGEGQKGTIAYDNIVLKVPKKILMLPYNKRVHCIIVK